MCTIADPGVDDYWSSIHNSGGAAVHCMQVEPFVIPQRYWQMGPAGEILTDSVPPNWASANCTVAAGGVMHHGQVALKEQVVQSMDRVIEWRVRIVLGTTSASDMKLWA
jgi:hypothetical protein